MATGARAVPILGASRPRPDCSGPVGNAEIARLRRAQGCDSYSGGLDGRVMREGGATPVGAGAGRAGPPVTGVAPLRPAAPKPGSDAARPRASDALHQWDFDAVGATAKGHRGGRREGHRAAGRAGSGLSPVEGHRDAVRPATSSILRTDARLRHRRWSNRRRVSLWARARQGSGRGRGPVGVPIPVLRLAGISLTSWIWMATINAWTRRKPRFVSGRVAAFSARQSSGTGRFRPDVQARVSSTTRIRPCWRSRGVVLTTISTS